MSRSYRADTDTVLRRGPDRNRREKNRKGFRRHSPAWNEPEIETEHANQDFLSPDGIQDEDLDIE